MCTTLVRGRIGRFARREVAIVFPIVGVWNIGHECPRSGVESPPDTNPDHTIAKRLLFYSTCRKGFDPGLPS